MANDSFMMNISDTFSLEAFSDEVTSQYKMKGYQINTLPMKGSVKFVISKNLGGINTVLGMGEGITALCTLTGKENDTLSVTFTDAEWTSKIIACGIGLFVCLIPCVTGVIGISRQLSLSKGLSNDLQLIANNL